MHVAAFAPSTRAVALDAGGVRLDGFPMTSAYVDTFPNQIALPVVLAVYTQGGSDYDPRRWIVAVRCKTPGPRVARCLALFLSVVAGDPGASGCDTPGIHTAVGL
jgi:hypothetical protein